MFRLHSSSVLLKQRECRNKFSQHSPDLLAHSRPSPHQPPPECRLAKPRRQRQAAGLSSCLGIGVVLCGQPHTHRVLQADVFLRPSHQSCFPDAGRPSPQGDGGRVSVQRKHASLPSAARKAQIWSNEQEVPMFSQHQCFSGDGRDGEVAGIPCNRSVRSGPRPLCPGVALRLQAKR